MPLDHVPVLRREVLAILSPQPGETVLDATVGLGGHARAFLEAVGESGRLIGLDADAQNLAEARKALGPWQARVELRHRDFREVESLGLKDIDVIFADLGLSSPHVDEPTRGFTFRENAPLDLRFDRGRGKTGAEFIAHVTERQLADIFASYGELPRSRLLARLVKRDLVRTTRDLVRCAQEVYGFRSRSFLPQIFQAVRIVVNDELGALNTFLAAAPALLRPGGRFGVICYHSLEDRLVKRTFRALSSPEKDPLTGAVRAPAPFALLIKKAVTPSQEEILDNPRSRSAKFRAICRSSLL